MMATDPGGGRATFPALDRLLVLLAATTGMIDAISVISLDKVFTANMTGNIVLLGFALTGRPGFDLAPYLMALGSFSIGAVVAGRMGTTMEKMPYRRWLLAAASLEAMLILAAAAMLAGHKNPVSDAERAMLAATALIAGAMGFRNATIRALRIPDLTTTALTQIIAALASESRLAGRGNPHLAREASAVLAILAGAALGAFTVMRIGPAIPLGVTACTIFGASAIVAARPDANRPG